MTATLKRILAARRKDLVDGFPARAVISASKAQYPLIKLNEELLKYDIQVELESQLPPDIIVNPYMIKFGVIAAKIDADRRITVMISPEFFDPDVSMIIIKALTFQSVCVHQLVHRERGHLSCKVFKLPMVEMINDEAELEAMSAGLAHDVLSKDLVAMTGCEMIQDLSPRLANLMDNSSAFASGSLIKLQAYVKTFM